MEEIEVGYVWLSETQLDCDGGKIFIYENEEGIKDWKVEVYRISNHFTDELLNRESIPIKVTNSNWEEYTGHVNVDNIGYGERINMYLNVHEELEFKDITPNE